MPDSESGKPSWREIGKGVYEHNTTCRVRPYGGLARLLLELTGSRNARRNSRDRQGCFRRRGSQRYHRNLGPALFGTRKIQTDSAGAYRFSQLPPGDYTITVSASGFATIKQPGIHADVGRLPSIDVTLEVVRLRRRWRLAKPLRLWTSRRVKWPSMSRKMSSIMFPRAG